LIVLKTLIAAVVTLAVICSALAQADPLSKTIGGVAFYLGVVPAEIVRGHPSGHPESTMHGSPPKESGARHLVVALFDAKTGVRIVDASVSARVEQVGLAAEQKDLEPMKIAGTLTYGNFYLMQSGGIYKIKIAVKKKGTSNRIEAEFEYHA
jgi:hypothetical protein